MKYLTIQDIQSIIARMNKRYGMDITIINKGQLEFALAKPKLDVYGREIYPELHQKAAVLMEMLTKAHTLSDGNKRTAMLAAELMVEDNGCHLVLPLKSIRLSVTTAMDDGDQMSELLQKWFKLHIACNAGQMCFMQREGAEEEALIRLLLESGKDLEAEKLLSKWMAFDNYPEHKKSWKNLSMQWKQKRTVRSKTGMLGSIIGEVDWFRMWNDVTNPTERQQLQAQGLTIDVENISDLLYNDNTMNEMEKAELVLHEAVETYETTKNYDIIQRNVTLLMQVGLFDDALDCCTRMESAGGDKYSPMVIRSLIHAIQGDHDMAMSYLERIDHNHMLFKVASHLKIFILLTQQKYQEAFTHIYKSLGDNLDPEISMYNFLFLEPLGKATDVMDKLSSLLTDKPDNAWAVFCIMVIHVVHDEHEKALQMCDKLVDLDPSNPIHYCFRGHILRSLKSYDRAAQDYEKSIKIDQQSRQAWLGLGMTMVELGRHEHALACFVKHLEYVPSSMKGLMCMVDALINLHRHDEALPTLDALLKVDSENAHVLYAKSVVLAMKGDGAGCLHCLGWAVEIEPGFKDTARSEADGRFRSVKDSEEFRRLIGQV